MKAIKKLLIYDVFGAAKKNMIGKRQRNNNVLLGARFNDELNRTLYSTLWYR